MPGKREDKLTEKPSLRTCKECGEQASMIAEKADISIRGAGMAIEIVADDVCLDCLLKAIG